MVRRTKAEAEATREALLDAAEEVFLRRGVSRATLEEIAREAGMTRGAVYWHFKNKTDLFEAMLDRVHLPFDAVIAKTSERAGDDPLEVIRQVALYALQQLAENERNRRVYTVLLHRCEFIQCVNPMVERLNRIARDAKRHFRELFEAARDAGRLRKGVSPAIAAQVVHSFLLGVYTDWLRDPSQQDLAADAPRMVDTLMAGLDARSLPPD